MDTNDNPSFIFYLVLEDNLPSTFYFFDYYFKELGYILLPVKIDQLQALASASEQSQIVVISSVKSSREIRIFNERIRGLLKYILKSKKIDFFLMSSFSQLNDIKFYYQRKNYHFIKYPFDARKLTFELMNFVKSKTSTRWPGGVRPKVGISS